MACPLCGRTGKHAQECINPEGQPQERFSWAYWKYLSQVENGDPSWLPMFLAWVRHRIFGN